MAYPWGGVWHKTNLHYCTWVPCCCPLRLPTLPKWFNHFKGLRAKTSQAIKEAHIATLKELGWRLKSFLLMLKCHAILGGGGLRMANLPNLIMEFLTCYFWVPWYWTLRFVIIAYKRAFIWSPSNYFKFLKCWSVVDLKFDEFFLCGRGLEWWQASPNHVFVGL